MASPDMENKAAWGRVGRPARILIVDDLAANRLLLADLVSALGYEYDTAEDGSQALEKIPSFKPDLIFLDLMMPVLDGVGTLEQISKNPETRHIPVIVVSGVQEQDQVVKCLEIGADDYLAKPYNVRILQARLEASLRKKRLWDLEHNYQKQMEEYNNTLESRVRSQVEEITSAQTATIFALSRLAESRDSETGRHLERIREYGVALARELALFPKWSVIIDEQFLENLLVASPLHDIGKVGIPDAILKKPGRLTPEEFDIMKEHTTIGAQTLRAVLAKHPGNSLLQFGIEIIESHHERWDGSGYPRQLKGEEIPPVGRIIALADVYDALTSRRCYKEPYTHEVSRDIILESRGAHFDPDVVRAFQILEQDFVQIGTRLGDQ